MEDLNQQSGLGRLVIWMIGIVFICAFTILGFFAYISVNCGSIHANEVTTFSISCVKTYENGPRAYMVAAEDRIFGIEISEDAEIDFMVMEKFQLGLLKMCLLHQGSKDIV